MTRTELAARIDHTILKPEATSAEVHRVATESMQLGLASVCVAPVWVGRVAMMLRDVPTSLRECEWDDGGHMMPASRSSCGVHPVLMLRSIYVLVLVLALIVILINRFLCKI